MPAASFAHDLWSLARSGASIDPGDLAAALERELENSPLDFRTRLLIRDSFLALQRRLDPTRLHSLLNPNARAKITAILDEDLGESGFPSLEQRLMDPTSPQTIYEFLRELGTQIHEPSRLDIGGSTSLILSGHLHRATEDIDVVDQLPPSIRANHELLAQLSTRFGLRLAHFKSHYLPSGWPARVRSLGRFGSIDVYLVDPLDIFVGKLFSNREKDRDDFRALKKSLEKSAIIERLHSSAQALIGEPAFRANAERNWYILFGESLPA